MADLVPRGVRAWIDPPATLTSMAWSTAADIGTTVGTVVALLGVLVTLVLSLRSERLTRDGQKLERDQAEATAMRSEAAARLTEEYTRRVVEALETMASHGPTGIAPEFERRLTWSLTHQSGDTYLLQNTSELAAVEINISAHESMIFRPPTATRLGPGEALTFLASRSVATSDSTMEVSWTDETSPDRQRWRYPLPPRPSRRTE